METVSSITKINNVIRRLFNTEFHSLTNDLVEIRKELETNGKENIFNLDHCNLTIGRLKSELEKGDVEIVVSKTQWGVTFPVSFTVNKFSFRELFNEYKRLFNGDLADDDLVEELF